MSGNGRREDGIREDGIARTAHLFVYGTLMADGGRAELLEGCERVRAASIPATLFDIDGRFPALMLYGTRPVHGELWRCPVERIHRLDEYEAVADGLFRRVGVEVEGIGSWTWVAGPKLAHRLEPERIITSGSWRGR